MSIFEKVVLKNMTVKNRLFRSATWDSLTAPDGSLNEEIYAIYEELARGGIGTIVTGLTDVSPYDWALNGNMRLCSDLLISDYKKLCQIVHKYDCRILVQLNLNEYYRMEKRLRKVSVNELTESDIKDIVSLFCEASIRAYKSGFDGVQLHLAYGWLLSRFLNPLENNRTDKYGGSTENRVRIVVEIINAVRESVPDLHISAKFGFFFNGQGEFNIEECVNICKFLEKSGIDFIEILGNHSTKEEGNEYEACYLELAQAVLEEEIEVPIGLTGNNHDIVNMEELQNKYNIALFGMCRPLIREPNLPQKWEQGSKEKAKCLSCDGCYTTYGKRCIFNVKAKLEHNF